MSDIIIININVESGYKKYEKIYMFAIGVYNYIIYGFMRK